MKPPSKRPRFDDGADASPDFRNSGRRIKTHKLQQLCTQVRRALELALLGELHDPIFAHCEIEDVRPGTDAGILRVLISYEEAACPEQVLLALQQAHGLLRAEVARAIHRKRIPEMVFELRHP